MSPATGVRAEPHIAVACAAPNATGRRLSNGIRRRHRCLQSGEAQTVEEAPPVATAVSFSMAQFPAAHAGGPGEVDVRFQ